MDKLGEERAIAHKCKLKLEKTLKYVYENKRLSLFLKWLCHFSVALSFLGFFAICYGALTVSPISLIKVILITGLPFCLVTLLRRVLDLKRPYQIYSFYKELPKNKIGRSFPSRHAYSSFVIGVTAVFVYPIFGSVLIFFGLLLSICRVLLGIHFIRDVLCGALIGSLCALIGVFVFAPF